MRRRAILIAGCLTVWAPSLAARTWLVHSNGSGDAPTIQAAIDSATTGDIVLVSPGTYAENLDMRGKTISLQSVAGAAATVVDGGARARVLTMTTGEVIGFTLRNGFDQYSGAGILVEGPGSSTIRLNIIEENTAGIDFDIGSGGGIYLDPPTSGVIIESNIIRNNVAQDGGGGIWDNGGFESRNEMRGNTISHNHCKNAGGGLVTFLGRVATNVVADNTSLYGGGGIGVGPDGHAIVINNTVMGNRTQNTVRVNGAGIQNDGGSVITHNIVVDNHGSGNGAGITSFAAPVPLCNDIWGNDINGVVGADTTGTDNFCVDPQFCAVAPIVSGNFSLQADSECASAHAVCGLIGAYPVGCGSVSLSKRTWTGVKLMYR